MDRRLSRRALVAASLLVPFTRSRVAGQEAPGATSVPLFRGNLARDGVNPGPGPAGQPVVRWQVQLGKVLSTTPVVVGGVVYIGSLSPGTPEGGALHAVDGATGIERWRLAPTPGDGIVSSPAVVEGLAVTGTYDGAVVAADAASGEERWRFRTGEAVFGSPAILDGAVYIGDDGGRFYALDAASGQERWHLVLGDGAARFLGSAALVDGTLFCVDLSRREWEPTWLHAWDAATGEARWRFSPEHASSLNGFPVVAGDTVFLRTIESLVHAVDRDSGEARASFDLGDVVSTDLAVADGVIYAGTNTGVLHAIEAATGATRWTLQLTTGAGLIAGPTVAGGRIYANDAEGMLHAVDLATGSEAWSLQVDSIRSRPTIVGGAVYIGANHGMLLAIGGSDQAA